MSFWRLGDIDFCAVSDAGWDELRALRQLLRSVKALSIPSRGHVMAPKHSGRPAQASYPSMVAFNSPRRMLATNRR